MAILFDCWYSRKSLRIKDIYHTCTVSKITSMGCNKLVDKIVSWTSFDLNLRGWIITAVPPCQSLAYLPPHNPVLYLRVGAIHPQFASCTTSRWMQALLRQLYALSIIHQPVPATPGDETVTMAEVGSVVGCSPGFIQNSIVVTRIKHRNGWDRRHYQNIDIKQKSRLASVMHGTSK